MTSPKERLALLQLSATALARLLGLHEGAHVDAVFQTPGDLMHDSFTFRIRGAGQEVIEGAAIPYVDLVDVRQP